VFDQLMYAAELYARS